jgi:DNA-binding transcriptional MerR regulator
MPKSAEAFRTISEVAEVLETPAHVLRFWESRFSQIKPVKRAGGRRYYRPADVALLGGIRRLLHDDGLTIRGVQKILREKGVRHVAALAGAEAGWSVTDGGIDDDAVPFGVVPGEQAADPGGDSGTDIASSDAVAVRPGPAPMSGGGPVRPWVSGDLFGGLSAAPRGSDRATESPGGAAPPYATGLSQGSARDDGVTGGVTGGDGGGEAPMELDAPTLPLAGAAAATPFPPAAQSSVPAPGRPPEDAADDGLPSTGPTTSQSHGPSPKTSAVDAAPAATLLRAMDEVRARSVQGELKSIHDRLSALRARLGQSG